MERLRAHVLSNADIVCTTLSFAGSGVLTQLERPFDVLVVDEAAQAVEPSLLVPLALGAKQVYLVGDPVQLPATVISTRAVAHNYEQSLFRCVREDAFLKKGCLYTVWSCHMLHCQNIPRCRRLQKAGYPVQVLDVQYRMHPTISAFPSLTFYQNQLRDAPGMASERARPWHKYPLLGPLAVLNVDGA